MDRIEHDWHLSAWLETRGKRQTDIVNDLGWNAARISLMMRGKQQYTREAVNDLAAYLEIEPYELLMRPEEALALRKLKSTAEQIANGFT